MTIRFWLMLIILLTLLNASLNQKYDHYRLPTAIKPLEYTLKIVTRFEDAPNIPFEGVVSIHFVVKSTTKNITLHVCNLTIDDALIKLKAYNDHGYRSANCVNMITIIEKFDYYVIHLCREMLINEEGIIVIPFKGLLNDRLNGYYKSSYIVNETNSTRWLSITQFEPTYARLAFPCLDEPIYKAKFIIWLGHERAYTAVSNMPLHETKPIDNMVGYVWSIFEPTVRMSTYLVAFSVNQFLYKINNDNHVIFRTWSRPDVVNQCTYANSIGPEILRFYEKSFGIKFALQKIDQFAVPTFEPGAMENWGFITYAEKSVLYSIESSSEVQKQWVTNTIAHELAHQWFGNLVTMKWWNDLWLNEGFATYMASLSLDYVKPDWQAWYDLSLENIFIVFTKDSSDDSHPVTQELTTLDQITKSFDSIPYRKGAIILRMLDLILGRNVFLKSLHRYLITYAYDNANTDDLWSVFTEVAHQYYRIDVRHDIKTIMNTWTLQSGYPLVIVKRDYKNGTIIVTQQIFRNVYSPNDLNINRKCWWIPLSFTSQSILDFSIETFPMWMQCDNQGRSVPLNMGKLASNQDWIIFNLQLSGLYRVMYDEANWQKLCETLNSETFSNIHVINRAQLIDDVLQFAWGGYCNYDMAFTLLSYMTREREYFPWVMALANLRLLHNVLRNYNMLYENLLSFTAKIIEPVYYHLKGLNFTKPEVQMTHLELKHKILIGGWACYLEVQDCVKTALEYFDKWKLSKDPDNENHIPTTVRAIVYCTAIRHRNKSDWEFLWNRYITTKSVSESETIINALACTRNKEILYYYMHLAFAQRAFINRHNSALVFGAIAHNKYGYQMTKNFFLKNINALHKFYSSSIENLGHIIIALINQATTLNDVLTFKTIFQGSGALLKKNEKKFHKALRMSQNNLYWVRKHVKQNGGIFWKSL